MVMTSGFIWVGVHFLFSQGVFSRRVNPRVVRVILGTRQILGVPCFFTLREFFGAVSFALTKCRVCFLCCMTRMEVFRVVNEAVSVQRDPILPTCTIYLGEVQGLGADTS